jgi:hypothetical protein
MLSKRVLMANYKFFKNKKERIIMIKISEIPFSISREFYVHQDGNVFCLDVEFEGREPEEGVLCCLCGRDVSNENRDHNPFGAYSNVSLEVYKEAVDDNTVPATAIQFVKIIKKLSRIQGQSVCGICHKRLLDPSEKEDILDL